MAFTRGLMGGKRTRDLARIIGGLSEPAYETPPYRDPRQPWEEAPGASISSPPRKGFDWGRAAAAFVGGKGVAEMFEKRDAARFAEEERQRLRGMAGQVIKDPAEWTAFEINPQAWATARLGQRFGSPETAPDLPGFGEDQESGGHPESGQSPLPPGWIDEEEHERARRNGPFRYFSSPYA